MNEKKIINGLKNIKKGLLVNSVLMLLFAITAVISKDRVTGYITISMFFVTSLLSYIVIDFINGYEKE